MEIIIIILKKGSCVHSVKLVLVFLTKPILSVALSIAFAIMDNCSDPEGFD